MTMILNRLARIAAILAVSAFAAQAETKAAGEDPTGKMMTNPDGMTLYMFDKDVDGTSTCYEDCAVKWMPYMSAADAKMEEGWTQIERTDGTMQLAYDGKPVYLFQGDKMKGDMMGDAVDGTWHVMMMK